MAPAEEVEIMNDKKIIYIVADHAGFNLKNYLETYLKKIGYKPEVKKT